MGRTYATLERGGPNMGERQALPGMDGKNICHAGAWRSEATGPREWKNVCHAGAWRSEYGGAPGSAWHGMGRTYATLERGGPKPRDRGNGRTYATLERGGPKWGAPGAAWHGWEEHMPRWSVAVRIPREWKNVARLCLAWNGKNICHAGAWRSEATGPREWKNVCHAGAWRSEYGGAPGSAWHGWEERMPRWSVAVQSP